MPRTGDACRCLVKVVVGVVVEVGAVVFLGWKGREVWPLVPQRLEGPLVALSFRVA